MAWHKIDQNLPGHPKTMRLRTLRRHKNTDETSGFMLRVWAWALDAKPDGMLAEVPQALAEALRVKDGEQLVRQLAEAGFVCTAGCAERGLDPVAHRLGRIHDWDETGGELVRQRAADTERKRLVRAHERGLHPRADVDGCPKCSPRPKASSGQQSKPPNLSSGQRPDSRAETPVDREESLGVPHLGRSLSSGQNRTGNDRPADASRARTREGDKSRGRVEKSPPSPTLSAGQEEARGRAQQVLDSATGRWREALQALLIGGMTSVNLCTWYAGTTLEERDGFAIVRAPNAFVVEWLTKHDRDAVATVLGVSRSRVLFALTGQRVDLEPEPVEDEEAMS